MSDPCDIVFIGNYTKDTIVTSSEVKTVDGGAFRYGAYVAAAMGLKTAAVTHLAEEDFHVVEMLRELGIEVRVFKTTSSTSLRLEYPGDDVDNRIIMVISDAGAFSSEEVRDISAKAAVFGASFRGEIGLPVIELFTRKGARTAVDLQGFLRVVRNGKLIFEEWPEEEEILSVVDVVKADAVEASFLTGIEATPWGMKEAARIIAEKGKNRDEPSEVLITHKDGMIVYCRGCYYEEKFYPKQLSGRSGRGDTCIAAYMSARLNSPPQEAVVWAAAVTTLKMENSSPFSRGIEEVNRLIKEKYS